MNILAIVAHPDDESFFAGGSLAKQAREGAEVVIVALSDGVSSRFATPLNATAHASLGLARRQRANAFENACLHLGAKGILASVFIDQESDAIPQLTINRYVERILRGHSAGRVYTHHVGDLNMDHRRVAEAVLVGTRQGPPVFCMTPEWPSRCVGPAFTPEKNEDLAHVDIERKVSACLCYADELRDYPHPRSEKFIREQTRGVEQFMEIR